MKKLDKKFFDVDIFFIFAVPLILTEYLKTYKIMKHASNCLKFVFPNPVDHYCDNIKDMVHFTLESLAVNPSNTDVFNNGIKTIDGCIHELDKLRSYLDIMKDIISDEMPLPF